MITFYQLVSAGILNWGYHAFQVQPVAVLL